MGASKPSTARSRQARAASSAFAAGWMCRLATPSTGLRTMRPPTDRWNSAASSALCTTW
jgi:hypothetical protein